MVLWRAVAAKIIKFQSLPEDHDEWVYALSTQARQNIPTFG
jgi:hypothetical protein